MTAETLTSSLVWFDKNPELFIAAIIWTLIWKGFALWRAAELRQKWWFIAFLVLNTLGILEIIYLFLVVRKYKVEIVEK